MMAVPPANRPQSERYLLSSVWNALLTPGPERTVVRSNDMLEETIPADQASPIVAPMTEVDMSGGAQVIQQLGLTTVPPVAIILMKSAIHSPLMCGVPVVSQFCTWSSL